MSTKLKINSRVKALQGHLLSWHSIRSNPTSCLINRLKIELGKVSKQLVEKINPDIIDKLQFNQWCYTHAVLKWSHKITDKSKCSFIQFDIKGFYPSMNENILQQTLRFAEQHTNIDKNKLRIIIHYRKWLLFPDNNTCKKIDRQLVWRHNG